MIWKKKPRLNLDFNLLIIGVSVGFLNENDNFSSTYLFSLSIDPGILSCHIENAILEKNPPDFVISHQSSSVHLVACHIKDWLQIIIHFVHT